MAQYNSQDPAAQAKSIFTAGVGGKLKLKDGFKLHLYTAVAPPVCTDYFIAILMTIYRAMHAYVARVLVIRVLVCYVSMSKMVSFSTNSIEIIIKKCPLYHYSPYCRSIGAVR